LVLLLAGCAKSSAPVGGEVDREPPLVVSTDPEPFAVVPGRDRPVVIRFDERISEKRISEAVRVSPESGRVKVKKGRSEIRVSVDGGWRPNQIYTVTILPVVQDLFNNTIQSEIELIFSTGPEIPATAAAGIIMDRITGQPVAGARVEALNAADSMRYLASSDTAGFFALRHIPTGEYSIRAYLDRNRNQQLDYGEPQDTGSLRLGASDTVVVSYQLLPADTTPARLVRAEERDSMQIRLSLDDYLDPLEPLDGVQVEIRELPDSTLIGGGRVEQVYEFERRRAEEKAAAEVEKAEAEKAAEAEKSGAEKAADASRVERPEARAERVAEVAGTTMDSTAAESSPLPVRDLVVIPEAPLARETRYLITISGIRNINGVEGGGGSAIFQTAAAVPVDSTEAVSPDSSAARPAQPDSSGIQSTPPDSSGIARPSPASGVGPTSLLRGWLNATPRR
jgi:hypothetical protein